MEETLQKSYKNWFTFQKEIIATFQHRRVNLQSEVSKKFPQGIREFNELLKRLSCGNVCENYKEKIIAFYEVNNFFTFKRIIIVT